MSEQLEKLLYIACDNKDYSLVQTYINRGVNVNCLVRPSYTDWTPLERAAHHGNTDIVKLLLQNGADVNQKDTDGETALMVSSVRGQVETAKTLIKNGAKVDLQNNNGWCALMWSSQKGHVESIKVLLDHKAQVDLQDKDGDSALIIACKWGKVQSVTVLLKHGANVNLQNHIGSTALICSLSPEISKLLLDNGAQVNHQNKKGETALMWACINEHKQTVEMLIKHGADVSLETKEDKKTAFTLARSSEVLELLKIAMGPSTANHELLDDKIDSRRQSQEDPLLAAVAKAMSEKGILEHTLVHGLFAGPAGSGKSSLMSRLLGEMPEVQSPSTGVARSVVKVKVRKSTSIACAVSVGGQDSSSSWLKLLYHEEAIATINFASQSSSLIPELGMTTDLAHTQTIAPASTLQESSSSVQTRNSSLPATREVTPPCLAPPKGYVAPISLFRNSFCDKDFEELRQHFQSSWSLYLTDTGGQIEFQEVLPLLVSGSSIFFITFRLDRDLNQRYTIEFRLPDGSCSESYESSLTVKEMILQILASVASMETATGNCTQLSKSVYLKPKVFIVGTHKDLLDAATREARITEVDEYLQKTIKSTAHYREDLVEYSSESRLIYAVNNLSDDDSDFQEIRSGVEKVVQRNEYKMSFPSPWLIFGLVLRQQSIEDGVISYEESLAIAKDCGIEDENELDNALDFLYKTIGLVCHFNTPCLKDVVIRDPQVIFDYVTQLIVQTFSFANVGKRRCEEFKKKGVFCYEDLLRGMQAHVTLSAEKFVEVLKYLQIAAPFQENGTMKCFMPCVLVHSETCQAIETASSNAANVVPPLLITFRCGYCPKGLAGALIVFLLTHEPKSGLKWTLRTDQIFRDRVSFLNTPWDIITLCIHPTYLLLCHSRVLEPASSNVVPIKDVCNCAREFVEEGLSHVTSSMKLTSGARHTLSFYCQDDKCIHSNGAQHPANEVIRNPDGEPCTLKCTMSGPTTISRPPDGCLTWFGKECHLDLETERKIGDISDPSECEKPVYTDCDERDVILNHKPKTNPSIDVERLNAKVKLIFLTCNENEKWAVYKKLQPPILDGSDSPRSLERALYIPQNHTVIGMFAEYTVAVLSSEKGKKCERDLKNALDTFPNAQAIIGIGVAYGKDEKTIQLGDVIVSDQIEDASQVSALQNSDGSLGPITIGQRGRRMPIKNELLRYFKPNTMEWHHGNAFQVAKDGRISEVKVGTVVSCETLMRSRNHRDQYMSLMAETVGGEMEGCSLLNMIDWMEQERRPLGVIVIKGVSDYGDNKDNKRWQFTAAKAAVDFVHYCLKETVGMAEFNAGINKMKYSHPSHIWSSGWCSKFFVVGMTVAVIVFALVLARFVHVWY